MKQYQREMKGNEEDCIRLIQEIEYWMSFESFVSQYETFTYAFNDIKVTSLTFVRFNHAGLFSSLVVTILFDGTKIQINGNIFGDTLGSYKKKLIDCLMKAVDKYGERKV